MQGRYLRIRAPWLPGSERTAQGGAWRWVGEEWRPLRQVGEGDGDGYGGCELGQSATNAFNDVRLRFPHPTASLIPNLPICSRSVLFNILGITC